MNRKEILAAASSSIHSDDMDHDYGKPEDHFETIAELWNTYLEALDCECSELGARDVAAMMILLKIARVATSTKADHWVDIAGYAACGGEIDTGGKEETASIYADNKELESIFLSSLGDDGPFELKFTVKKEDDAE